MGIFFGLAASFGWGMGDFLVRGATRRVGSFVSLLYMQGFGLLCIMLVVLARGDLAILPAAAASGALWLMIPAAVISVCSTLLLYRSLAIGMLSIVSPIVSSYAAVTLVLSLLTGERLTPLRLIGALVALAGVVLASIEHRTHGEPHAWRHGWRLPVGVPQALGCALLFGIAFWLQGFYVIPYAGPAVTVLGNRLISLAILVCVMLLSRRSARLPDARTAWVLFGVGVLDTLAFIASSAGAATDQVSIVTVLSSMFSAWTVLLAWIVLRERPHRLQWAGIALILCGVVLVSLGA